MTGAGMHLRFDLYDTTWSKTRDKAKLKIQFAFEDCKGLKVEPFSRVVPAPTNIYGVM